MKLFTSCIRIGFPRDFAPLILESTFDYRIYATKPNQVISFALKLAARHVLEDMTRTVQAVRDSDLDWTVIRVPMLLDDPPKGKVRVGRVGVSTGPRITRADMASFMLTQLQDSQHLRQSPVISN